MIEKQDILEAIVQTVRDLGSVPGRVTFENRTGIRRHEWYGRYWPNWGEALKEAGFEPNKKTAPLEIADLLRTYLGEVKRLQRVPSEGELRVRSREYPDFPATDTFRLRLGKKNDLLKKLLDLRMGKMSQPKSARSLKVPS